MNQISNNRQQFARKPQSLSKEKKENLSPAKKPEKFCRKPQTSTNLPSYNREPMKVKNQQMEKASNEETDMRQDVGMQYEKENFIVKIEDVGFIGHRVQHDQQELPPTFITTAQQQRQKQQSQNSTIFAFLKPYEFNLNNEPYNLHSHSHQQSISSGNTSDQYSIVGDEDEFLTSFNNGFVLSQGDNNYHKDERQCELDESNRQKVSGSIDTNKHKTALQQSPCVYQCAVYEIVGNSSQQPLQYRQKLDIRYSTLNNSKTIEFNKSAGLAKIVQYPEQCQQSGFVIQYSRDLSHSCQEEVNDVSHSCSRDNKKTIQRDCDQDKEHVIAAIVSDGLACHQPILNIDQNHNQDTSQTHQSQQNYQQKHQHQQLPQPQLITFQKQQQSPRKQHQQNITRLDKQQQYHSTKRFNYATDSFGNNLISSSLSMSHDNDSKNKFMQEERGRKMIQISHINNQFSNSNNNNDNEKVTAIINANSNNNSHTASFPATSKQSHYNRNKYCSFFPYDDDSSLNDSDQNKKNHPDDQQQQYQHEYQRFTGDGCTQQSIPTSKSGYTFTDSGNERYCNRRCDVGSISDSGQGDVSIEYDLKPKYLNQASFAPQRNKGKSGNNFYYQFDRNYEQYDDESQYGESDYYENRGSQVFKVKKDNNKNDDVCNNNQSKSKIVRKENNNNNSNNSIHKSKRTNHNNKANNKDHNRYANPFRSPQLMRHLPSTVHNPSSHSNQFYNTHIQKMDSLIVQILQMKKTFQLHYIDSIKAQTHQCESNTAVVMRQLADIQNRLDCQFQQGNRLNGQKDCWKKQNHKTTNNNSKPKLNKLKRLINYSSKDDYNSQSNRHSSRNNASEIQSDSQNNTQLQCSIAQQLHTAKLKNLNQNYSNHSMKKLPFQNSFINTSSYGQVKQEKDKQQCSSKENSLKYTNNDGSILLLKPQKSSSILNKTSNNFHHNHRDLLPICLEQNSHDKSSSLAKINKHNLSRQSNPQEEQQQKFLEQSPLMFSSKRKRSRKNRLAKRGSQQSHMNHHRQQRQKFSSKQFENAKDLPEQSMIMNDDNNIRQQNKQWNNSWDDDENSGTISDNTSVQHSDNEQISKKQIELLNIGSNNNSNNFNSSSQMMLSSLPYVCMVVSTKKQLKRALKEIKKPHSTIKTSLIQQNEQVQQQGDNSICDNATTLKENSIKSSIANNKLNSNQGQQLESQEKIIYSKQQESQKGEKQQQQQNIKIVVKSDNNDTNKNTLIEINHEGEEWVTQQQQKQQQGVTNQQSCSINDTQGDYQNTQDDQPIRMRSVGAYYYDNLNNGINHTEGCKNYGSNEQRCIAVDGKEHGLLALTCQQREEVIISNNNNANSLSEQVQQQKSSQQQSNINNSNNNPSLHNTSQHQASLQSMKQHSICRITQPILDYHPISQPQPINTAIEQKLPIPISFNKKLKQGRCCRGVPRRIDVINNFRQSLLNERKQRRVDCQYYDHVIEQAQPVKDSFHHQHQESTAQSASSITIAKLTLNNSPTVQILSQYPVIDSIYYQRHDKQLYKYNWFKFN